MNLTKINKNEYKIVITQIDQICCINEDVYTDRTDFSSLSNMEPITNFSQLTVTSKVLLSCDFK